MTQDEGKPVRAEENSVAVGSISIGGSVDGNITIGNVTNIYNVAEEDAPFKSEAIENGLIRFAEFLPERAPVMTEKFNAAARKLRATFGAETSALSPALKSQREDNLNLIKLMCMEALDISFRALCQGQNPPPYDSRPPFLGLFAFRPEDKEFYFGREALIEKLVKRIKAHSFLAVVGSSGSGKSSLVMAGLIPALDAEMTYLTPSSNPLEQIQVAQAKAAPESVWVVDQFEELFTLARDAKTREAFIAQLLELSKSSRVIVTMRADFWGEVAAYKNLKQEMQDHQELIAPMDAEELRDAMQKQADVVGLRFAPALGESILEEVKDEPGAMPLLQHALWMLWKRRHGLWLKAEEYQAFGGIRRAIATTADELYEGFTPEDRERMRNIFVRLTNLDTSGKAALDTRRRVRVSDLVYRNDTLAQTTDFIRKLANARLLITSSETLNDEVVEVAHEALIRNWTRLRSWLDEDRLSLLVQEDVREAASVWEASANDNDAIVHYGGKLEDALHLMRNPRTVMNTLEVKYLETCKKLDNPRWRNIKSFLRRWLLPLAFVLFTLFIILPIFFFNGVTMETLVALAIGTITPLLVAFFIYKQDRYRIVEGRWFLLSLLDGALVYFLSAQINPALWDYEVFSREQIIQIIGPIIETILKGLALYFILTRLKFSRTLDGMIYGTAIGAGYAVFENYEYVFGHSDMALKVGIERVLSTNVMHIGVLGLSGFLLVTAGFDRSKWVRFIKIFGALTLPSIIQILFNTMVNSELQNNEVILFVLAIGFGLSIVIFLSMVIRYLIAQEEKWITRSLQGGVTVEGNLHVNKVEQISKTIKSLFGSVRASQMERFLILQAQRGILQKALDDMDDPKLQRRIEEQIAIMQKRIRGSRAVLGTYCWENLKAVMPEIDRLAGR